MARLKECWNFFWLTAQDPKWRNHRLKELLRTKECVCDFFFGKQLQTTPESLKKYFLYFGIANRLNK